MAGTVSIHWQDETIDHESTGIQIQVSQSNYFVHSNASDRFLSNCRNGLGIFHMRRD